MSHHDASIKLVINEKLQWPNRVNARAVWSLDRDELERLLLLVDADDPERSSPLRTKLYEALAEYLGITIERPRHTAPTLKRGEY